MNRLPHEKATVFVIDVCEAASIFFHREGRQKQAEQFVLVLSDEHVFCQGNLD